MALTGNFAGLQRLERELAGLANGDGETSNRVVGGMKPAVRDLLREQFAKSIGPEGERLKPTIQGRPALVSKKLPAAFQGRVDRGSLRFVAKSKRDMLTAHQEGHTFPARQAGGQSLFFNEHGKLLRLGRLTRRGLRVKFVEERVAKRHTVRARTLPSRPIAPASNLPARYQARLGEAFAATMTKWGRAQGAK